MSFCRLAWRCMMAVSLCLALSGCWPAEDGQLDEQKESHFLAGRNRVNNHEYPGAVAEYEKSLEVIPHSAAAHFEIGWLCDQEIGDPAAAIYHYQRFLAFQPNSDKADLVKSRINACKLELAKTVSAIGPQPAAAAARDWDKLLAENRDLKEQLIRWQSYYTGNRPAASTNAPPPVPVPTTNAIRLTPEVMPADNPRPAAVAAGTTVPAAPPTVNRRAATASSRTYAVKARDNPAAIARKFGVPLNALLAANPQIRPTHLSVGQVLNIPAP